MSSSKSSSKSKNIKSTADNDSVSVDGSRYTVTMSGDGSSVFDNGARPAVTLSHPKTLSDPAIKRLANQMDELRGSRNAGKTVVLEEGLTVTPIGFPPEDAQFLQTQLTNHRLVYGAYGIPSVLAQLACDVKVLRPISRTVFHPVPNVDSVLVRLERLFAGTIHAFCAHLLRERPVEAGVAPGFTELDEMADLHQRRPGVPALEILLAPLAALVPLQDRRPVPPLRERQFRLGVTDRHQPPQRHALCRRHQRRHAPSGRAQGRHGLQLHEKVPRPSARLRRAA